MPLARGVLWPTSWPGAAEPGSRLRILQKKLYVNSPMASKQEEEEIIRLPCCSCVCASCWLRLAMPGII
jgi:hypothetical protein